MKMADVTYNIGRMRNGPWLAFVLHAAACGPGPPRPDVLPVITDCIGSPDRKTTKIHARRRAFSAGHDSGPLCSTDLAQLVESRRLGGPAPSIWLMASFRSGGFEGLVTAFARRRKSP
jgi:hypothetical protein